MTRTCKEAAARDIALSFAFAFRNALEEVHVAYGEGGGLGQKFMVSMNKRCAHLCYVRLCASDICKVLMEVCAEEWVEAMWQEGIVQSGFISRTSIPVEDLLAAREGAVQQVWLHIAAILESVVEQTTWTNQNFRWAMPEGWDDPSTEPPDYCGDGAA